MRILIVVSYYSPHISGLTLYVQKLANILSNQGNTVTILTSLHQKGLKNEEVVNGVRIIRLPIHIKISKSPFSFNLVPQSLKLVSQNDLVILNLPSSESVLLAPISRILNRKLLVIHHCDPIVPDLLGSLFTTLATISNFYSCIFANKIISYTADYAQSSPVLKHFLHKVIPLLPPVEINKPNPATISRYAKLIGPSRYTIGFAGRISEDKGIRYLLESIPFLQTSLTDFKIVLAGPTRPIGESYIDSLQTLINKFKKHLVFLESIVPADMINFYKSIDALVLPSINRTESFGMVQVEAMLSGKPVIASDLPGVRQPVIITGGGLISNPRDPSQLSSQIVTILRNPRKYHPKSLEQFSVRAYGKNIKHIISRM